MTKMARSSSCEKIDLELVFVPIPLLGPDPETRGPCSSSGHPRCWRGFAAGFHFRQENRGGWAPFGAGLISGWNGPGERSLLAENCVAAAPDAALQSDAGRCGFSYASAL